MKMKDVSIKILGKKKSVHAGFLGKASLISSQGLKPSRLTYQEDFPKIM